MPGKTTKDKMLDALDGLLRKKPLRKITVEEILQETGVSKPTFYRYFKDKYDMCCRLYDRMQEPLNTKFASDHSFRDHFKSGCWMIYNNQDLFASLFEDPFEQNSFYQYFVNSGISFMEQNIDKNFYTDKNKLELYRCMHGNIYVAWEIIKGNIDMDFDKSMDDLIDLMPAFIKLILQI